MTKEFDPGTIAETLTQTLIESVTLRTQLQQISAFIADMGCIEYDLFAEEVETAINAFYDTEASIGNAYRHLIVAAATETACL